MKSRLWKAGDRVIVRIRSGREWTATVVQDQAAGSRWVLVAGLDRFRSRGPLRQLTRFQPVSALRPDKKPAELDPATRDWVEKQISRHARMQEAWPDHPIYTRGGFFAGVIRSPISSKTPPPTPQPSPEAEKAKPGTTTYPIQPECRIVTQFPRDEVPPPYGVPKPEPPRDSD